MHLGLELEAGYVYQLTVDVPGADGSPLANRVAWYTLHVVPR